jgi:chemotaxis regulatin CheY-phosphate phosphatase CheZ
MAEHASDDASAAAEPAAKTTLTEHYAALEAALSATPRGRWFLAEYARRNRAAETDMLLEAIMRLEDAVLKPQRQGAPADVLAELKALSEAIANTRREIARIRPPQHLDKDLVGATEELDGIVAATERATSDILEAAEDIQEVAWTMREKSIETALCDKIDRRATDIYTACSFQDITGQRTARVVRTLRFVEQRINAMIASWGTDRISGTVEDIAAQMQTLMEAAARDEEHLLNGPQGSGEGLKQEEVDRMLTGRPGPESAPQAVSGPPSGPDGAFATPDPLIFMELDPAKRAALFG